jgi:hypothetical protein
MRRLQDDAGLVTLTTGDDPCDPLVVRLLAWFKRTFLIDDHNGPWLCGFNFGYVEIFRAVGGQQLDIPVVPVEMDLRHPIGSPNAQVRLSSRSA